MSVISFFRHHGRHCDGMDLTGAGDSGAGPAPRPSPPLPAGVNPYDAPLPRTARDLAAITGPQARPHRPRGMQHTAPFTPEFAEQGKRGRPYAPRNIRIFPLPPEQPKAPRQIRERRVTVACARLDSLGYPACDGIAPHAAEYAAVMREVSRITGTHSPYERPGAWSAPRAIAWPEEPQLTFTAYAARFTQSIPPGVPDGARPAEDIPLTWSAA